MPLKTKTRLPDMQRPDVAITCPFCFGHGFIEQRDWTVLPCTPCEESGELWIHASVSHGQPRLHIVGTDPQSRGIEANL